MATNNPFKAALREGRAQIGLWQALASPLSAELCAAAGFDWLLLDGEHGPNDVPGLLAQLQAVAAVGAAHPVGRVPVGETWIVKQYLDIGFTTLLVPMVDSGEDARRLARACRYPPDGIRGVGAGIVRASRFNRRNDYLATADEDVCLLVQVETVAGLADLEAIAAADGVDGVFFGPADLSAALGFRGQPGHPAVRGAIARGAETVRAAGKAVGVLASDEALAKAYLASGFTFVAVGTDVGLLVRATDALAARFKSADAPADAEPGAAY
jgi:4-hydroxy-2-oxoheptanedioate aldolase